MAQRLVVSITLFNLCELQADVWTFLILFFQDLMKRKVEPSGKEGKRVAFEVSAPFFDSTHHLFFAQVFTPFRLWKITFASTKPFTCQPSTFWKCLFLLFHVLFVVTDAARRSDVPAVRGGYRRLRRRICEYSLCQLRFARELFPAQKVPSLWEKRSRSFRIPVSIVSHC